MMMALCTADPVYLTDFTWPHLVLFASVTNHRWSLRSQWSCLPGYQFRPCTQSGHALLTQVRSMSSWTLPCVSSLVPSVLHLSHDFQCSPILNRQPYEGRLPLTSWWRKSSNMTVGQSSLISLANHCYDWHPESRCGWTCNQLTSNVDGSRLR